MPRTRSRPETGSSMSVSAAICTTVSRWPARRSHVGHRLQRQAHQHGAADFLRAHAGNALQREPGAVQLWMFQCCAGSAAALHARRVWTLQPGFRNEFHAGFQQAAGKNFVFSGDYIWKYTHNAFDFSVLGNTPITFPIDWHNSKIPGFALRADVPNFHNISAFVVMSSVSARFFPPQSAGAGATVGQGGYPFRIDHDERFNETTHVQYQLPGSRFPQTLDRVSIGGMTVVWLPAPYLAITSRTQTACAIQSATSVTLPNGQPGIRPERADRGRGVPGRTYLRRHQGDSVHSSADAMPGFGIHLEPGENSSPGTENDDKNPPRIQPRNLFDASIGEDNIFKGDRYRWSLRLTGVNIANKYALYNFLSTFSGTHYVTPRALTAEVGLHF